MEEELDTANGREAQEGISEPRGIVSTNILRKFIRGGR